MTLSSILNRAPRPVLLDVYCCEGGAGKGYHDAGFDVIGIDRDPQPRYPYEFIQADALEVLADLANGTLWFGAPVAAVHASPPCQAHSDLQKQSKREYPDLIAPTREMLEQTGLPYVIENVDGAPLRDPVTLCGTMFPELRVIRHRLFETNWPLEQPPHPLPRHPLVFTHDKRKRHYGRLNQDEAFVQVTGGGNCTIGNKRAAMGTPWMSGHGCNEAIPPAYTRFIGERLLEYIQVRDDIELVSRAALTTYEEVKDAA